MDGITIKKGPREIFVVDQNGVATICNIAYVTQEGTTTTKIMPLPIKTLPK